MYRSENGKTQAPRFVAHEAGSLRFIVRPALVAVAVLAVEEVDPAAKLALVGVQAHAAQPPVRADEAPEPRHAAEAPGRGRP